MAHKSDLIAEDIHAYLKAQENKGLLRFITCGSVDDGKSTLIGRLLYESKLLFEDQLAVLEMDSKKSGTQGEEIDLALLVDGLAAEREQGITIDVAYRFFSTDRRKFIVADTPGHEQYTRNMATGASTADVAIVLIDARKGVLTQTRRHSFIVSMLGVKKVVLAINKMDLVDYAEDTFVQIEADYREFAENALDFEDITAIPVSALKGDNIIEPGEHTSWYTGPCLLEYLETTKVKEKQDSLPFRFPVQWVNRTSHDFRGFAGQISGGCVHPGDRVRALPSGRESRVARIVTYEGDLDQAISGQSVTLTLEDEIDISRGDVLAAADSPCSVADQFEARILWMADEPMLPGRPYLMKIGAHQVTVSPAKPKHKINVNTLALEPAKTLGLNEIGVCNISLDQDIPFDAYDENRAMGGFIMIDKMTNNTVGMGLLNFALRRASNIHWQSMDIDKTARATQKNQRPAVLWFTGLSGSGKSTIANIVEKKLHAQGKHTVTLDGDNIRHGLNRDLGFTSADRVENIRRVGEVARLMVNAGLITITAFISPFQSERELARGLVDEGEFVEIHVNTPLHLAEERDVKGLYKKARAGEIKNFTGIDSPYETPEHPEIRLDTETNSAEACAEAVIEWLDKAGYLS
ncbi:MAG: sulfate adenylyltransferase subunit CysN [Myxococcota bacterium]|nr:sulfate adenylyltransferase subunit CysN [Myxococcota bacterium]